MGYLQYTKKRELDRPPRAVKLKPSRASTIREGALKIKKKPDFTSFKVGLLFTRDRALR